MVNYQRSFNYICYQLKLEYNILDIDPRINITSLDSKTQLFPTSTPSQGGTRNNLSGV